MRWVDIHIQQGLLRLLRFHVLNPALAISMGSPVTIKRASYGGSKYSAYEDAKIAVAICAVGLLLAK